MSEQVKVILSSSTSYAVNKVLKELGGKPFVWAYFGESVKNSIAIEGIIKNKGKKIEIGKKLQETARELRQPYIDYVGRLSVENNSLMWWSSSLSEKRSYASKTFLNACYIKICLSYLNSNKIDGDFVFFIENKRLMESLKKNISTFKKFNIKVNQTQIIKTVSSIKEWIDMLLIKSWFFIESLSRIFLSKHFYKSNLLQKIFSDKYNEQGLTIIFTFIDNRSFDNSGKFVDSYLGKLADHLRNCGSDVSIVPWVLNPLSPYFLNIPYFLTSLKKMQRSAEKFLVPYAFLNTKDIIVTITKTIHPPKKKSFPPFENIEISDLIYDDFRRDWTGITLLRGLILFKAFKGWKDAGIKINGFIYPFENQTWEKSFCIALREFFPEAKIIGYQHSTIPYMLLNFFYSANESDIIPLPDRIITNGKHTEKLLTQSGYDPRKISVGGAIRYTKILAQMKLNLRPDKKSGKPKILVSASISPTEAEELILKTITALGQSERYEVIIKCHPITPYKKIAEDLGIKDLPRNFELSERPIPELLKECHVLLYTSSTTSIEAIALGVPVIHIESDFMIDMDPLDFVNNRNVARTTEEILQVIEQILSLKKPLIAKEMEKQRLIVGKMFGEVGPETYKLFKTSNL